MPVLIDYRVCDNSPGCSAIRVCPQHALSFNPAKGKVEVDDSRCSSACNAICTRVCPAGAVKWFKTEAEREAARKDMAESNLSKDDLLEQRYGIRPGDPRELGPNLIHVDDDNFETEVLQSDVPVVVDFWAEWCAPCRILAPTFKALATEYEGRMKFGKLDTEEAQRVAMQYGIMSIPTLLFFNHGQVVDRAVGALPREQLRRKIEGVLARN